MACLETSFQVAQASAKEALVLEKQVELVLEGLQLLTQQGFLLLELLALHQEPPGGKTFSWIMRLVVVWHSPLPLRLFEGAPFYGDKSR